MYFILFQREVDNWMRRASHTNAAIREQLVMKCAMQREHYDMHLKGRCQFIGIVGCDCGIAAAFGIVCEIFRTWIDRPASE